jgi:hypothetical protein
MACQCKGYKDERVKGKPEASPVSARRVLQEPVTPERD